MKPSVKPRPAILRALGKQEPPDTVTIGGKQFSRLEVFKHDSWAATALYQQDTEFIVCKFNRVSPILFLPTGWLGRWLGRREDFAYSILGNIPGIAGRCDAVFASGQELPHAVAHQFIAGHPLKKQEQVNDQFFPGLLKILQEVHSRGFAYVDLHKRENILMGDDYRPYLIDFQISYYASRKSLFWPITRPLLQLLQQSDLYHFSKHVRRLRPDQIERLGLTEFCEIPWWIRLHRSVAVPFRTMRRRLLISLKVRGQSGKSSTEIFSEHAFRCDQEKAA